ncbi:MAG: MerR family transcriptional regulator [Actinobacteria bacterium]|nr:MerR family transcriptional regulator [Actinomycetota bacterium]
MTDRPGEMTIDDLARTAAIPVSTVRMYQHRGLLAPPTKRGRVGYYDDDHVGRLRLIAQLQGRGFSLAGIKELVDGMEKGDSLGAVLGLGDRPPTWTSEAPREMTFAELAEHLPGVEITPDVVRRVVELGLVEVAGDGSGVVLHNPSFLEIGSALAALGIPTEAILDQYAVLRDDADRIAGRFTDLFRTHLWEPFVADGLPQDRIGTVVDALEQLGPLAEGVVVMALRHALQDRADAFIRSEADRLDIDIPRPGTAG